MRMMKMCGCVMVIMLVCLIDVVTGVTPMASVLKPHLGTRKKTKSCVECQIYFNIREMQLDAESTMKEKLKQAIEEGRKQQIKREMGKKKKREGAKQSGYPFYQQLDKDDPVELAKDQKVNECLKLPVPEQQACIDGIEGLGTTNKVPGGGGESSIPTLPDLAAPTVPDLAAPKLPDLPNLPPIPNIPNAKIPGLDAMQKILDMISSKIEALRPPKLPTLPTSLDLAGNLAGGALSAGFGAPPLTAGGSGTLGLTHKGEASVSGSASGSVNANANLPSPPPMPRGGGGGGGGGGGSSSSSSSSTSLLPGFRERSTHLLRGEQQHTLSPDEPRKSVLEEIFDLHEQRKIREQKERENSLYAMLELNSRIKMIPTSPEGKRLMNPKLVQGTDADPLKHPSYNPQNNHPTGKGTTNEVTGQELYPLTTMKVCANEQVYGIHVGLLKSIFKGLPGKQITMECTPDFGIEPEAEL